jgi:ubiquitin carboxyl-terminal hydrolase 16/45
VCRLVVDRRFQCWKIANGQIPARRNTQSDVDSDDSSDEDEQQEREEKPSRPELNGPVQSFSMPNLSPAEAASVSSLPQFALSSLSHPASNPALSEVTALDSSTLDLNNGRSTSTSTTSFASVPPSRTNGTGPQSAAVESGPRGFPIPTIAPISPPPNSSASDSLTTPTSRTEEKTPQANRTHFVHFPNKLAGHAASSRDSLRLPHNAHSRHPREAARDGESSLSSEESEYDDTSGISDGGDGSLVSTPNSGSVEPRSPRRSGLPRSKQVIYRRALKRYLIARPPPILVIHLKRFQQVSKSTITMFGNLKKLDDYVSFPEVLDIRPFLAPKKEDYGLGRGALRGRVTEKGKRDEDRPCMYRLYAVVVHIGNMVRILPA